VLDNEPGYGGFTKPFSAVCDMMGETHMWVFHAWTQWRGENYGTMVECKRCGRGYEIQATEADSFKQAGRDGYLDRTDPLSPFFAPRDRFDTP
jgi:hypothetical protein